MSETSTDNIGGFDDIQSQGNNSDMMSKSQTSITSSPTTDATNGLKGSTNGGESKKNPLKSPDATSYVTTARVTRPIPPPPSYNPMQFVQIKPCSLYQTAQEQLKKAEEVKKIKEVKKEEPEDWQNNLDNWKSSRRKRVEHIIDRVVEVKKLELEEHDRSRRKSKTFSEMIEERGERPGARGRTKLTSLAIYNEDETNDLSDLGIGTSSGKSSLSEDYDNNSVTSETIPEVIKDTALENRHNHPPNAHLRARISSPGYETSSSTAPASSPDPYEYTYEGAIQDYKQRISRTALGNFSKLANEKDKSNNENNNITNNISEKNELNDSIAIINAATAIEKSDQYSSRRGNKIESTLSSFEITSPSNEQEECVGKQRAVDDLPKIDISKRKEIFENQKATNDIRSPQENGNNFNNNSMMLPDGGAPPKVTLRERFVKLDSAGIASTTQSEPEKKDTKRLSGNLKSIQERMQSFEQPKDTPPLVIAAASKSVDVPVPPLKERLFSLQNAAKREETKKPPVALVDARQLEIMKNEEEAAKERLLQSVAAIGGMTTETKSESIDKKPGNNENSTIETNDLDDSGIHTTDDADVVESSEQRLRQQKQEDQLNAAIAALAMEEQELEKAANAVNQIEAEFDELSSTTASATVGAANVNGVTQQQQQQQQQQLQYEMDFSHSQIDEALELALEAIDKEAKLTESNVIKTTTTTTTKTTTTSTHRKLMEEQIEMEISSSTDVELGKLRNEQINAEEDPSSVAFTITAGTREPIYENIYSAKNSSSSSASISENINETISETKTHQQIHSFSHHYSNHQELLTTQPSSVNIAADSHLNIFENNNNNNNNINSSSSSNNNKINNNNAIELTTITNNFPNVTTLTKLITPKSMTSTSPTTTTATPTTTSTVKATGKLSKNSEEKANATETNFIEERQELAVVEPYYQVPKSSEPYYDAPKHLRPVPVYENIEIFYNGLDDNVPLLSQVNSMEPPKEKPPPPPIVGKMSASCADDFEMESENEKTDGGWPSSDNTYETITTTHHNHQNHHHHHHHQSTAEQLTPPIKRVNSTKRIKKELRNKRSSFLGIDASEFDDEDHYLEMTIAPPPNMSHFLQQERQLEKQLYMKTAAAAVSGRCDSSDTGESRDSGVSENHSRQSSEHYTNSSEENERHIGIDVGPYCEGNMQEISTAAAQTPLLQTAKGNSAESWTESATVAAAATKSLTEATATANAKMLSIEEKIREQEEVLRVERELLQLEQEELKRQRENLLVRENMARRELQHGAKMLMSANRCSLQELNNNGKSNIPTPLAALSQLPPSSAHSTQQSNAPHQQQQQIYVNLPNLQQQYYQMDIDYRKSMSDLSEFSEKRAANNLPPPIPPTKPMRASAISSGKAASVDQQQYQHDYIMMSATNPRFAGSLVKIAAPAPVSTAPRGHLYSNFQHRSHQNLSSTSSGGQPQQQQQNHQPSHGNMTRNTLHALSATPKPKYTDGWVQQQQQQLQHRKSLDAVTHSHIASNSEPISLLASYQQKRKSMPDSASAFHAYNNNHWLMQEAEQRRRSEEQKQQRLSLSNGNTPLHHSGNVGKSGQNLQNGNGKPLPDAIIQTLTERVQSKGIGERKRLDNLKSPLHTAAAFNQSHHLQQQQQQQQQSSYLHESFSLTSSSHGQQIASSGGSQDKVLSVSGKKKCSHCGDELGRGAAMIIESLLLFYHINCFKCCVCHVQLGDGLNGTDVRVRNQKLHCQNCYSSDNGIKFSCV